MRVMGESGWREGPAFFSWAVKIHLFAAACLFGGGACSLDFDRFTPSGAIIDAGSPRDALPADAEGDAFADSPVPRSDADAPTDEAAALSCSETEGITFAGHCYFVTFSADAWDGSRSACQFSSAHLVTITSSAEQSAIAALGAAQDRWIGLSRPASAPATAGSFQWLSGEAVSYSNWDVNEPNPIGACARRLAGGRWAGTLCAASLLAICERD
jgi:hypothetical protein